MITILFLLYLREQQRWLIATSTQDCAATTNLFDQCGSRISAIAKAQSASNNMDWDNAMTTLTKCQCLLMSPCKEQWQ
jgi:hypothetical protein